MRAALVGGLAVWLGVLASCESRPPGISARGAAILGGEAPPAGERAEVGALVHDGSGAWQVFCTGTLIAAEHVLTAAHCLSRAPAGAALGFFAGDDFRVAGASSSVIPVRARHPHPDFVDDPPDVLAVYHDIAVLELVRPLAGVAPARLVRPAEVGKLVRAGAGALIVGFGQTEAAVAASKGARRQAATRIGEVGDGELWVLGSPDPQKCAGDSGGPTFGDLDESEDFDWRLIGVASRAGQGCQDGSAETRADRYLDWIHGVAPIPCGSGKSGDCPAPPPADRGGLCAGDCGGEPAPAVDASVGDAPVGPGPLPPPRGDDGCAMAAAPSASALALAWIVAVVLACAVQRSRVRRSRHWRKEPGDVYCAAPRGRFLSHP